MIVACCFDHVIKFFCPYFKRLVILTALHDRKEALMNGIKMCAPAA